MQNPEISKQNVGDDPMNRPKITSTHTRIKRGTSDSCETEIELTVKSAHGNNYHYAIQLIFSSSNFYNIPSTACQTFPTNTTILYSGITGTAYSNPNQTPITVKVDGEEDINVSHNYTDTCSV